MNKQLEKNQYYRFQLFHGTKKSDGKIEKNRVVGMSYLKEDQDMYTLRLWTLLNDKFFLIMNKHDSSKYLIMSREHNKNPSAKNKYFWNVIGSGKAHSALNCLELQFDLFEKPIFMSIFPETVSNTKPLFLPEDTLQLAG